MADPFIREHLEQLLKFVRGNALLGLIKPYKNIKISFISQQLRIEEEEVENLLVSYILDGCIQGRIDQVNGMLKMTQMDTDRRHVAMENWADSLVKVFSAITIWL